MGVSREPARAMRVSRDPTRAILCLAGARATTTKSSDPDEGARM